MPVAQQVRSRSTTRHPNVSDERAASWLDLADRGKTYGEIAELVGYSENTVARHVPRARRLRDNPAPVAAPTPVMATSDNIIPIRQGMTLEGYDARIVDVFIRLLQAEEHLEAVRAEYAELNGPSFPLIELLTRLRLSAA